MSTQTSAGIAPKKTTVTKREMVVIREPNIQQAQFKILGTAPYVQHKFSKKAWTKMLDDQVAGPKAKNKKTREARDVQAEYLAAMHKTVDGQHGIPAPAFRAAMISACRLVGFQMTKAKLSVFVEPDGFDYEDATPLVLLEGEPEMHRAAVRLESGVASVAIRPMWKEWGATVRVSFDADQFSVTDVGNLLARAGLQVGIGEGRPDSKKSNGMGWGLFKIEDTNDD